ncbi:MAG TPA: methionine--tRNA ligase [Deltaproteobacteria bacterium]|nr:methionine--tRNA ligase [SAR324 cluster bacterium]HIN47547.1 methionine--tRNA ligase [Deltaproteobacteria bacterium]
MNEIFYITTPIYYVNSHPHIGHAYTTIATDVLTRFRKLFGADTYFLTGTDEHGQKIAESAAKSGIEPQEFVDRISQEFRVMWPHLHIENDQFIRTTDPEHKACVQQILQKIYDQGEIYLKEYEGLYCVGCERFMDESELVDGNCPDHQNPPELHKEQNYFFGMSAYQDWLVAELEQNENWVYPARYRNELTQFLKAPLQDLCISRPKSRLEWGIELPFDKNFVTYVWFDALLNYASALGWPDGEKYKKYWPHVHHTIGKDILKTHGIYWPCMLKAAGMPVFKKLVVHGHWVVGGSKMSKSLGNVVDPLAMKDQLGVDALRYFLMRDMSFGEDANFTEELAITRYNGDLANNLGNLLNRSISMSRNNFEGCVPPLGEIGELEKDLRNSFSKGVETCREYILAFQPHRALEHVMWLSSLVNKYIDNCKPWSFAKQKENRERLGTVLYTALDMTRILVGLLDPVMPEKMREARISLGLGTEGIPFEKLTHGLLESGTELPKPTPLFPKMQVPGAEKTPAKIQQKEKPTSAASDEGKEWFALEDFQKMELKVGHIRTCRKVEKSAKLLCSEVDLGEGRLRSIVSGAAEFYTPEEMTNRRVLVVANLKTVKLMGEKSEGMILFSDDKGKLILIEAPDEVNPGVTVR